MHRMLRLIIQNCSIRLTSSLSDTYTRYEWKPKSVAYSENEIIKKYSWSFFIVKFQLLSYQRWLRMVAASGEWCSHSDSLDRMTTVDSTISISNQPAIPRILYLIYSSTCLRHQKMQCSRTQPTRYRTNILSHWGDPHDCRSYTSIHIYLDQISLWDANVVRGNIYCIPGLMLHSYM